MRLANGDWPPYLSKNLPHYGAASHIVSEAFEAVDLDVHYEFFPWKRSYILAQKGQLDGTLVWVRSEDREKHFHYSDIVIFETEYLYHLKTKPLSWYTMSDLEGLVIGTTHHTYYPLLEKAEMDGLVTLEPVGNHQQLYDRLLKQRIDAIPHVSQVARYYLQTNLSEDERLQITHSPTILSARKYHLILSKNFDQAEQYIDRFNEGLGIIKANGLYDKILLDLLHGKYDSVEDN